MTDEDSREDNDTHCKGNQQCKFKKEFRNCGYDGWSLKLDFRVKKNNRDFFQRYDGVLNLLREKIYVSFLCFSFRKVSIDAPLQSSGVTLENIAYCTEYELEIHLKGKKEERNAKEEEIDSMQKTLTKQQPNPFVKPYVTLHEEYTSLTCSAR